MEACLLAGGRALTEEAFQALEHSLAFLGASWAFHQELRWLAFVAPPANRPFSFSKSLSSAQHHKVVIQFANNYTDMCRNQSCELLSGRTDCCSQDERKGSTTV